MTDAALKIATDFIAAHEGFISAPQQDVGGTWNIGYGFTYPSGFGQVTASTPPMTQERAFQILQSIVASIIPVVRAMVDVPITNNQAAALTSFAYNEGTHALRCSTLLSRLNQGDYEGAADAFMSWVFVNRRVVTGLVNRRRDEVTLFKTPDNKEPGESGSSPG